MPGRDDSHLTVLRIRVRPAWVQRTAAAAQSPTKPVSVAAELQNRKLRRIRGVIPPAVDSIDDPTSVRPAAEMIDPLNSNPWPHRRAPHALRQHYE